ncbi:T9SS type A sorting domain-containing protein [Hymenobacter elongatus]|uniref:T9SS type A sorting domain-containing protein n=1 Tax=Hymenobacter elongatus TaxID=877208 RepID=A0A4Z0PPP2_9BACT|nr:T9SS type A sorting domain-containing protein [Hymenobacter elongatus]TGE19677.1 T9SS type A sorting domain-containing protein [Hymenobacter elongatus]
MLRQPDGKYVISGNFTRVNGTARPQLARINADGTLDPTFVAVPVQPSPELVRLLPSGRTLLFGPGTLTVGGQSFRNLVQLNSDGTLGPALATGTGSTGPPKVVAVQADGKILLGGTFTAFNGVASSYFVRLNADGSVDTQFTANMGAGFAGEVKTMVVQPDGKIVVGGRFQDFNGTGRQRLVRLNANGSYDNSFVPAINLTAAGANVWVAHLALDPRNNDVLVEGPQMIPLSGGFFQPLFRLTSTGAQVTQFAPGTGQSSCYLNEYSGNDQMIVDSKGRVLLGSCFEKYMGSTAAVANTSLIRLLTDGTIDPQSPTGATLLGAINTVVVEPDDRIVVAGNLKNAFTQVGGASLVRLTSNAQPDPTFQPALITPGYVARILRQSDGKLLVAGRFTSIGGQAASNLVRLQADGSRDASFAADPNYTVESLEQQPDGRLLIGGRFTAIGSNKAVGVARLQSSGIFDPSFNADLANNTAISVHNVRAIAVQADGKVLIGGISVVAPAIGVSNLHRLLPNGRVDEAYGNNLNSNAKQAQILCLKLLPDGRAYVGGVYSASNGSRYTAPALVRLTTDGRPDPTFVLPTSLTESSVLDVLPLANGQVVAAGRFSTYNGADRANMVRLNADGTVDTGFDAHLAGDELSFVVQQPNIRLLIGSSSNIQANGVAQGMLARLLPNGALDASFAASATLVDGPVYSAVLQPTGEIVVGGQFSRIAGQARWSLARLNAPQVLMAKQSVTAAATKAWPIPAHDQLYLSLDAASTPSHVQLLDAMGRVVLTQRVTKIELALPVQHLRPGMYLLRVNYVNGPVTRRIIVE